MICLILIRENTTPFSHRRFRKDGRVVHASMEWPTVTLIDTFSTWLFSVQHKFQQKIGSWISRLRRRRKYSCCHRCYDKSGMVRLNCWHDWRIQATWWPWQSSFWPKMEVFLVLLGGTQLHQRKRLIVLSRQHMWLCLRSRKEIGFLPSFSCHFEVKRRPKVLPHTQHPSNWFGEKTTKVGPTRIEASLQLFKNYMPGSLVPQHRRSLAWAYLGMAPLLELQYCTQPLQHPKDRNRILPHSSFLKNCFNVLHERNRPMWVQVIFIYELWEQLVPVHLVYKLQKANFTILLDKMNELDERKDHNCCELTLLDGLCLPVARGFRQTVANNQTWHDFYDVVVPQHIHPWKIPIRRQIPLSLSNDKAFWGERCD